MAMRRCCSRRCSRRPRVGRPGDRRDVLPTSASIRGPRVPGVPPRPLCRLPGPTDGGLQLFQPRLHALAVGRRGLQFAELAFNTFQAPFNSRDCVILIGLQGLQLVPDLRGLLLQMGRRWANSRAGLPVLRRLRVHVRVPRGLPASAIPRVRFRSGSFGPPVCRLPVPPSPRDVAASRSGLIRGTSGSPSAARVRGVLPRRDPTPPPARPPPGIDASSPEIVHRRCSFCYGARVRARRYKKPPPASKATGTVAVTTPIRRRRGGRQAAAERLTRRSTRRPSAERSPVRHRQPSQLRTGLHPASQHDQAGGQGVGGRGTSKLASSAASSRAAAPLGSATTPTDATRAGSLPLGLPILAKADRRQPDAQLVREHRVLLAGIEVLRKTGRQHDDRPQESERNGRCQPRRRQDGDAPPHPQPSGQLVNAPPGGGVLIHSQLPATKTLQTPAGPQQAHQQQGRAARRQAEKQTQPRNCHTDSFSASCRVQPSLRFAARGPNQETGGRSFVAAARGSRSERGLQRRPGGGSRKGRNDGGAAFGAGLLTSPKPPRAGGLRIRETYRSGQCGGWGDPQQRWIRETYRSDQVRGRGNPRRSTVSGLEREQKAS